MAWHWLEGHVKRGRVWAASRGEWEVLRSVTMGRASGVLFFCVESGLRPAFVLVTSRKDKKCRVFVSLVFLQHNRQVAVQGFSRDEMFTVYRLLLPTRMG